MHLVSDIWAFGRASNTETLRGRLERKPLSNNEVSKVCAYELMVEVKVVTFLLKFTWIGQWKIQDIWGFQKFFLPILLNLPKYRYWTIYILNCELCKIFTTHYMNCSTIRTTGVGHICKHDLQLTNHNGHALWQIRQISSIRLLKRISENLNCTSERQEVRYNVQTIFVNGPNLNLKKLDLKFRVGYSRLTWNTLL